MRIDVHVHMDTDPRLHQILTILQSMQAKENRIMASLVDLSADVAQEKTVDESAIALLTGLSEQIAALKTTQTDPATGAAIDALDAQLKANTQALADAVTANTVA